MGLQILPRHMMAMVIVVALMVIAPLLFDQMEQSVTFRTDSRWNATCTTASSLTDPATTWNTIVNLIVLMVTIVLIGLGLRYLLVYLGVV